MDKTIQKKIKEIQELLVKNIVTSYQIEKDTYGAIKQSSLNSIKDGTADIDNLRYKTVRVLIDWYDRNYTDYAEKLK
ncbi:hypothetical protein EA459_03895 [Streptococcus dysgalactiae subsp. dysgalactiae]|nr:hypothetical protein [Streptococcus dysgalactiae]QGG97849.1 hypothetical protein EA459_03895 [Streptococcus dysgalactiae subsp. dysgalactiae]